MPVKSFLRSKVAIIVVLALATALTFQCVRRFQFLGMDDHVYVWNNDAVKKGFTPEGIRWALCADLCFPDNQADYWQPMTFLSRMLDVQLFGMDPGAHHLVNLFFHILNASLLFIILWLFTRRQYLSFLAALLFALHPLNSEVLGWVTARKDVLSHFFALTSMALYFYWGKISWKKYALLVVIFAFGLMSKPTVIVLPALLFMMECMRFDGQFWLENIKSALRKTWPFFLVALAYFPIPWIGQPHAFKDAVNPPVLKAVSAYGFYLQKILWPSDLTLYGPVPYSPVNGRGVGITVFVLGSITALAMKFYRREKMLAVGWGVFLICMLPSVFIDWPADRFTYLSKAGILIMLVWAFALWRPKVRLLCLALAGVIAYIVLSVHAIMFWQNDQILMERALRFYPNNYAAHNLLGVWYGQRSDLVKAEGHLQNAIDIYPGRDKPWANLGNIRMEQKRYDEARRLFRESLKRNPDDYQTITNLGNAYINLKDYKRAIEVYQEALKLRPNERQILNNMAIAYLADGDPQEALKLAEGLQDARLYFFLGARAYEAGDKSLAIEMLERSVNLNPESGARAVELIRKIQGGDSN